MSPTVVFLGAGNMAYHLSFAMHKAEIPIIQIYNRSQVSLESIDPTIQCEKTTELDKVIDDADVYIISISDDAIESVAGKLKISNSQAIICHTSGNHSSLIFQDHFSNYGVFYPLQSVKRERSIEFRHVPIFVTGNNEYSTSKLSELAFLISEKVEVVDDLTRSKLHIPAVMVNNFTNFLYSLAYDYCVQENLDFAHLIPLMEETLDRVKSGKHPKHFQTGPAIRKDANTIKKHRDAIQKNRPLLNLYNYLTRHISRYYYENSK